MPVRPHLAPFRQLSDNDRTRLRTLESAARIPHRRGSSPRKFQSPEKRPHMNRTAPASLQRLDRPRRRRRLAAGLLALGTAASVSAIAAPADAAPIAPAVVERYAPMVFLYSSDDNRPTTAERFVDNSRLRWNHDQDCPDDDVTDEPRASTLGNGGYRHRTAGTWPICSPGDTVYRSNQFTRPYSGIAGDEGFFLDLRD